MFRALGAGFVACWLAACVPPAPPPGSQMQLCRGGQNRDRGVDCRELGPMANPAPAVTRPAPGPDAGDQDRAARPAGPRSSSTAAGAAPFEGWPAGSSPREVGARVAKNYLARPLSLGAPMHYAEACTWYGALTTAKLLGDVPMETALVARFS